MMIPPCGRGTRRTPRMSSPGHGVPFRRHADSWTSSRASHVHLATCWTFGSNDKFGKWQPENHPFQIPPSLRSRHGTRRFIYYNFGFDL